MQIKIVQTEIEEAIRNHIQNQIMVREGMNISIDLSATRGAEGFIATIDISPNGSAQSTKVEAAPAPALATATAVLGAQEAAEAPAATRQVRAPRAAVAQPPVAAQDATQNTADADVPAAADPTADIPQGEPTAAPAGKSLFGGLNRPNNG